LPTATPKPLPTWLHRLLLLSLSALAIAWGRPTLLRGSGTTPPPPVPAHHLGRSTLEGYAATTASFREVFVDYDALGAAGKAGGEWLTYDLHELTRPLTQEELWEESELSVAVRLIISEVGADRLLVNRLGLLEAVGILYTVQNRLDDERTNPLGMPHAPEFPGCGPTGDFKTCSNAQQYLGMATWRALDPTRRYPDAMLAAAVDLSVLAWWLQRSALVPDPTGGATSYVHRCGGEGYGLPTYSCDGTTGYGRRSDDVRGADPHTGPLVFRAQEAWLGRRGFYSQYQSRWVDYVPRLGSRDFRWLDRLARAGRLDASAALVELRGQIQDGPPPELVDLSDMDGVADASLD
jgi:hypothetical protein